MSEWTATATHPDGSRLEWDGVDVFPLSRWAHCPQGRLYDGTCCTRAVLEPPDRASVRAFSCPLPLGRAAAR